MIKKDNPHVGSTFESWLDEQGIREEVIAAAAKDVVWKQVALKPEHGSLDNCPKKLSDERLDNG